MLIFDWVVLGHSRNASLEEARQIVKEYESTTDAPEESMANAVAAAEDKKEKKRKYQRAQKILEILS